MKILHTIAGVWTETGGPAESVPSLCAALARRGHEVVLLTGAGELAPAVRSLDSRVRVVTVPLGPYLVGNFSRLFAKACVELARNADILHTHGLWLHPNFATFGAARRFRRPVAVSPRGMLSPWALKQGRLRKRLVWCALQRRLLAGAAFIHATSVAESQDIRLAGVVSPVATVSNGLDIRNFEQQRVASFREHGRERIVLFVSRVHPKKGLDVLLTAWKQLGARRGSARLLIAGPGEARHVAELVQILSSEQIGAVEYIGPVDGDEKISLLSRAIAVVLPSWSENYGMVVAEALACGTPVITTYGVPWPQLESRRCGWRVNVTADELEMAIEEALANNEAELDSMGKRGREYVEQEHTVDAAAEKMEAAYDWARGLVNKPEFVT